MVPCETSNMSRSALDFTDGGSLQQFTPRNISFCKLEMSMPMQGWFEDMVLKTWFDDLLPTGYRLFSAKFLDAL